MNRSKVIALRRINKDLKEITDNPIEGIGIVQLDNDDMKYIINIKLMAGVYEGYCLQLLLIFNENYPSKPPKILIFPNQRLDGSYHHHIFDEYYEFENSNQHFKKFCFDLLDNDFMSTGDEHTGWNPSYTISSLLLQVQNFIADPDLHYEIPKQSIDILMKSMDEYERVFNVTDEKGNIKQIKHTWKNPYPPMYFGEKNNNNNNTINIIKNDDDVNLQLIKENLTCFMLKSNYIDDKNILLGYPIVQQMLGGKKIELYPIPELLTYDGFISQKEVNERNHLNYYFNMQLKSSNNEYYNHWIPIYIDENHYNKNKETILKSFCKIKNEIKFKPEFLFEILPIILNKMIIGIFNGKTNISSVFIRCYFQYILLFKKFCEEFSDDYKNILNGYLKQIKGNNYNINKKLIPDIGNFFVLLFFLPEEYSNLYDMKKVMDTVIEEFLTRQMYWLFHSSPSNYEMKNLLLKFNRYEMNLLNDYDNNCVENIFEFYKEEKNIKNWDEILDYAYNSQKGNKLLIITCITKKKIEEKDFIEKLKKNYGVYLEVDNFIKEMKNKITEIKNFKELYEYVGVDFGKDKSNFELIKQAYIKAKKKEYIKSNNNRNNYYDYNRGYRGQYYYGGRGRGYLGRKRRGY